MIKLKTKTINQSFSLPDDICKDFKNNILFYRTPSVEFFPMFCILDFNKKELRMIKTDTEENIKIIKDKDPDLLNIISHSSTSLNSNGFYCMPHNRAISVCFKYMNYKDETIKIIFGSDLKHPDSKHWGRVSSSFQKPTGEEYMLVGFLRTDKNVVDIVKVDEDLNAEVLFSIPDMLEPPHEIAKFGDLVVATSFHLFKGHNKKTGRVYKWAAEMIQDGYDIDNLPDHVVKSPGELFTYNLKTKEFNHILVDAPPTAHFDSDRKTTLFSSAHNFTSLSLKYYFFGPAQITKWDVSDGTMKKIAVFEDEKIYRCTTHIYFEFEGKKYLTTLGYPNRLAFIDTDTMKIIYHHDLDEDLLTNQENTREYINYIHRNNSIVDKHCLNDINVSSGGRYIIYFEKDKARFYDFKNRREVNEFIPFPTDPAYSTDMFRTIMHTTKLR